MRVRQASKHELAAEWGERYLKAKREERVWMLDEFVVTTSYHRKYAIMLLRQGPPKGGTLSDRTGRR